MDPFQVDSRVGGAEEEGKVGSCLVVCEERPLEASLAVAYI